MGLVVGLLDRGRFPVQEGCGTVIKWHCDDWPDAIPSLMLPVSEESLARSAPPVSKPGRRLLMQLELQVST
jgi:hypothetical protein